MSIQPTIEGSRLLSDELCDGSSTNTLSLFEDSISNDAYDAFKLHLDKNPVKQYMLDRCLMSGMQIVQKQERELSQVAPTLLLLLKFGAKWRKGELFENVKTPNHLICQSNGDHHELLDLMLLFSRKRRIDTEDWRNCTALVHAIRNSNINCVRSLLKSGADVNHYSYNLTNSLCSIKSPLVEAITKVNFESEHLAIIQADIFDLLLSSGADVNKPCNKNTPPPVLCALDCGNIECVKKLIQSGARLGRTDYGDNYVWAEIVRKGNVEVLQIVIEHGIDEDSTDTDGKSMLRLVIESGDVEAVRYLLDLGVTLPTYQPNAKLKPCKKCGTNRLCMYLDRHHEQANQDPCIAAIDTRNLNIIHLLEKHGAQSFNSLNVFIYATNIPDVIEYLLNKYTYPLNIEYTVKGARCGCFCYCTLLVNACYSNNVDVVKVLLDHGADPNKKMCEKKCFSVINIAIRQCNVKVVAHLIRSGLDVNSSSYHYLHGYLLPFEAAVLDNNHRAAKMLLVSGGAFGVYSLNSSHEFKTDIKPALQNFIEKWNVGSNNVNPLEQQCRRVILKNLSPQAHKRIKDLPLPQRIIEYLRIPELDDMVDL